MQIKACYHRPIDKVDMEVCFGYHQMPDTGRIDDFQENSTALDFCRDDYDMYTANSIVALVRGLETVTLTVAKCLQYGVVGEDERRGSFLNSHCSISTTRDRFFREQILGCD